MRILEIAILSPWWLLGLVPVAAVALWSLFRPGRAVAEVGSLELWSRAAEMLPASHRRRARRVTGSWLLLLIGAVAAILAAARPVAYSELPARRIAVEVRPSAEIAGTASRAQLAEATAALLDRLAPTDRVQLLLPHLLGGASEWIGAAEVRARLQAIAEREVFARADELSVPPADPSVQRVYRFVAAGAEVAEGQSVSIIEIPHALAPVTVDALGAEELPDGRVQLFVALSNQTDAPWNGTVRTRAFPDGTSPRDGPSEAVSIGPGQRRSFIHDLAPVRALAVEAVSPGETPGTGGSGYLARREAVVRTVAMIGPDAPHVRRYVAIDPGLQLIADPDAADIVIANRTDAPAGKAALVIDPPSTPPGWRRANESAGPIRLADADLAAGDPVMRGVDLAGVAVRSVAPWIAGAAPAQVRLVGYKGDALILRSEPSADAGAKRIFVAFDLSGENTNFPTTDAFVIFLANATRWLGGEVSGKAVYSYVTPLRAGPHPGRMLSETPDRLSGDARPLPPPGVYLDEAGGLHAVSLIGLRSRAPEVPPLQAVSAAPLPPPQPVGRSIELWAVLAVAAVVLWLIGWSLRLR
jgi:hypothetical protein